MWLWQTCLLKFRVIKLKKYELALWFGVYLYGPFGNLGIGIDVGIDIGIGIETSLASVSEERNSAMDVIWGVLKIRKTESCSLYVCVFLIKNFIKDHFLEFSEQVSKHL